MVTTGKYPDRTQDSFNTLRTRGIVKTQGDFAGLLGIAERSLSAAKNGDERYLTENLISRISSLMDQMAGGETSETIPVIPTEAMAGTLGEFAESVHVYECERMISPIKGADYAIKVCGDSMTPEIPNGSQILIKKIKYRQKLQKRETQDHSQVSPNLYTMFPCRKHCKGSHFQ